MFLWLQTLYCNKIVRRLEQARQFLQSGGGVATELGNPAGPAMQQAGIQQVQLPGRSMGAVPVGNGSDKLSLPAIQLHSSQQQQQLFNLQQQQILQPQQTLQQVRIWH